MRRRITDRLGDVPYDEFLVYLMGPYKSFSIEDVAPEGVGVDSLEGPFGSWDEGEGAYDHDDVVATLRRLQGSLRADPGVNAFLAVDADIDLEEMDAATQTIEFARASNVVVFAVPMVGKNLGVGIEVGSVLADLDDGDRDRVVFVHEEGVRSAMIQGVARRWDAAVYSYADESELVDRIRLFVTDIMYRELRGDLDRKTA
jgi:hypothetical protein